MLKKIFFSLMALVAIVTGAQADVTIGITNTTTTTKSEATTETLAGSGTDVTVAKLDLSSSTQALSTYTKGDKAMNDGSSTSVYSTHTYKWGLNTGTSIDDAYMNTGHPNEYVGFSFTVAEGKTFSISGIAAKLASSANHVFRIRIEKTDGTVLYTAAAKTISRESANEQTITGLNADNAAGIQSLAAGTYNVKAYLAFGSTGKYLVFTKLQVTGTVGEAAPAKAYTVTAASNNEDYGTAATSASSLDESETATITATPKTGYEFISWAVEGEGSTLSSTTTNPTTLTMGTANATVTATFSAINYAITHNDATGGTYTISVAGGEATDANTTATMGQTITLAGTPTDPAQTYIRWNVKDADNNDVTVTSNQFTMPAKAVTISPVFSKPLNTLFSMTGITAITNDTENAKYGTVTATISDGGSVDVFNNKGGADGLLYSGNSINLNGSGDNYIHITFPTKLVAGDEISATFLAAGQGWKLNKTKSKSGAVEKTNPYTLTASDALIGATELYIYKIDAGCQISAITVKGEGQLSDLEVTSSATPVVAIGATSDIEYTSSSTGAMTFTSSDEEVATVSATGVITGVDGGTATITINQDADSDYRAGVATVTVTVPSKALLKIITLGGSSTKTSGTASFTADVDLSSNKKMDKGKYAGFTLDGENTIQTGDVIEVGIKTAQTGENGVFVFYDSKGENPNVLYNTGVRADEAKAYKFIAPATMNGAATVYLRRGNDNSGINEGWNPEINYIAVYRPDAFVTLNAAGFATYSSENDFEYAGADAYGMNLTATALTSTKETTGKVAAGEGILFKGEAGATVAIIETAGATAIADNSLLGTTMASGSTATPDYTANKYYALKGGTFKYYTGATFAANKAVFCVDKNTNLPNEFAISFDEATAIKGIAETEADAAAPVKVVKNGQLYIGNYNVAGQQVK